MTKSETDERFNAEDFIFPNLERPPNNGMMLSSLYAAAHVKCAGKDEKC
jgi:hypothetical protein